jgi:rare lipoprotein A
MIARMKFFLIFIIASLPFVQGFSQAYIQEGIASYYADKFEGRTTASGEKYKHSKFTAAHKTLPFGTLVRVTNKGNSKTVDVKINDRGPFVTGRIIDLSKSAAQQIDMINEGLAEVTIEVIDAGDGKGNDYSTGVSGQTDIPIEEKEYYELGVTRSNPSGYGVQIGSFRELANLIRLAENLKASYKKKVTVQVSVLNDVKVYKIIIGQEKSREKSEKLRDKLKKRYPDSFIITFADN